MIQVQGIPGGMNTISLIEATFLHEILQNANSSLFTRKELKKDNRLFEKRLKWGSAHGVFSIDLAVLNKMSRHVSDYLNGNLLLQSADINALHGFISAMLEFGSVSGLSPDQIGLLLAIVETLPEFSSLQQQVEEILYVQRVKKGFTWKDLQALNHIVYQRRLEEDVPLSPEEKKALLQYIKIAQIQGGLNGFRDSYRIFLLRVVAQEIGNGFSLNDFHILSRVEQRKNGFSSREMTALYVLKDKQAKKQSLTAEEKAILKKFEATDQRLKTASGGDLPKLFLLEEMDSTNTESKPMIEKKPELEKTPERTPFSPTPRNQIERPKPFLRPQTAPRNGAD